MTFEWDERKNEINKRLHGVDFETAKQVFADPNAIPFPDPYPNEERWDIIGFANNLLFVVYTERSGDVTRIISAREATKEEKDGYRSGYFGRNDG